MSQGSSPDVSMLYDRPTISVPEAGHILGIGRNSAYEAAKRGEIPVIRLGRLERVPCVPFRRLLGLD
jgi:excisionase family DNA binding protein